MLLAEEEFVDLYLSKTGETGWFKRNGAGMHPVPAVYAEELQVLANACLEFEAQGLPEYLLKHNGVSYRVAHFKSQHDEYRVLRKQPLTLTSLHKLGMHPAVVDQLMVPDLKGLILIAGKTKSGKTTTASALVAARLAKYGGVCMTVEDPPEMPLEGKHGEGHCFQTCAQQATGGFASELYRTVRCSPDIILLGEVRDNDTASEALRACVNGHLIISTIHAGTPQEAIERLVSMSSDIDREGARNLLADGLCIILAQSIDLAKLAVKPLFFGEPASGVRAKVRRGELSQLTSDMQTQINLLARTTRTQQTEAA